MTLKTKLKKPRRSAHTATSKRSSIRLFFSRLFCKRNIIIISDHKTQHLPVHPTLQLLGLVACISFVTWASYSTGSYMAAQAVLREKDKKIAITSEENERIGSEFALLRRDLSKLITENNKGNKGAMGEYAKMMAEQYNADGSPKIAAEASAESSSGIDQNAILSRIEFLENKVKHIQDVHEEIMADIRTTTGGKIKELESLIAKTGVNSSPLVKQAELRAKQQEQQKERYERTTREGGSGGPFIPAQTANTLKTEETDLYFNLKRLMRLHDVVSAMPLASPMPKNTRITSGYGTRVDPFNGRLAKHTGIDFAGPYGSAVRASSDGVVKEAGWQSGYGKAVDIVHDFGFSTKYGHLSKWLVKPGQRVKKGDVIALQGSTGRSTGTHLHYEVRYNDRPLNPRKFLQAGVN